MDIQMLRSWSRHGSRKVLLLVGVAVVGTLILTVVALELAPPALGCSIKGNIADGTGERIYHLPGQKRYLSTRINLLRGERWFCSESSAQAAGWRKSRV
jgi:hypothetical protein